MEPEWTEAMDLPEGLEEQCALRPALRTRAHSRGNSCDCLASDVALCAA